MADKKAIPPPSTPIPTTQLEMASTISEIKTLTMRIADFDLPRVETKVDSLDSRVGALESRPPLHICTEKDRQDKQDKELDGHKKEITKHSSSIKGTNKLKAWFIGVAGSIATAAIVFAITTQATEATHTANIQNNTTTLSRHEKIIEDLPRKRDLDIIRQAVDNIPKQLKTSMEGIPPTISDVASDVEELPLKAYELEQLRSILGRAKKREKNGKKLHNIEEEN